MHIAVLSDPANFHTQKWSTALVKAGAKVTIFSFSDYQFPEVPCVKIEPSYTLNGKITYPSYLYTTDRLKEALLEHGIDVINPVNVTPYAVWATRTGLGPVVSVAMGADILEYPPEKGMSDIPVSRTWESNQTGSAGPIRKMVHGIKWRVFRQQVKEALDKSDLITGDNRQLIKAMREWFEVPEKKLKLNRWGLEEDKFEICEADKAAIRKKYDIRDWQKVILSPRGMKPVYQGDLILESFEMLVRRGMRDGKLIMLSAGYEVPPAVDKKARELSAQFQNFHYEPGILPREEVLGLWSVVDAFVNTPVYDGYSNSLSEGRFAGAIPIVNNIPANRELIRNEVNGIVVDPFTPQHLADTILELLPEMDEKKARFAPVNRKWIQQHSILEKNIRIFLRDCEKVLKRYRREQKKS